MTAPLYAEAATPTRSNEAHRGLWYDRFFNRYDPTWQLDKSDKKGWIDGVAGKAGDSAQIEAAVLRVARLCGALSGKTRAYAANWHFATGLGNPHPVENGFLWHPTLGVPYLTGSAVKGLVRAWVEAWMPFDQEQDRLDTLYRWFGSEDKAFRQRASLRAEGYRPPWTRTGLDTEAGGFIFFDALPITPVMLKCDVMTPHMGKWYEQGGEITAINDQPERIPADWHDPVPVYFLVADRPKLQFAIAPRTEAAQSELNAVIGALDAALQWLGAGAKTAAGYGLMDRDTTADQTLKDGLEREAQKREDAEIALRRRREREAQLAQMNPLEKEIETFLDTRPDKNQTEIVAVLLAVRQGKWQGDDKRAVAGWLQTRMQTTPGQWKPQSQAKRPERDKEHQNTLLVLRWLQGN